MGRPKKTDPPTSVRLLASYDGKYADALIEEIESFAKLHNCKTKDISVEIDIEHGYYDEISSALMMHAPKKKAE